MATYILLTRVDPAVLADQKTYLALNEAVEQRIKKECPAVTWKANYAVFGPYDYLDVFEAPSNEVAARVALIVRTTGHATTETWSATSWDTFKTLLQGEEQQVAATQVPTDQVAEATRESFPASDPPSWTRTTAT